MNTFTYFLFDSPWLVIAGLAITWTLLRIAGRRSGNKRLLHLSWVALGLIGALWLSATLVTTPREELESQLKALLDAVEDQDIARFREVVLPEAMTRFPLNGMDVNRASELDRDAVEAQLNRAKFDDIILLNSTAVVDGPTQGATLIRVRAEGASGGVQGMHFSEWAIRWRRVDGQWRAQRLQCTAVGADAFFNKKKD